MDEIMVSICCLTYNHEKYVKDALEGFVSQKTSFNFEVLIHDDASTDNTANIIKEYEKKYPDIIKPIYQKENQYSKGLAPGRMNRDRASGKYIAMCEGDDYWIDPLKLQKQVDYMNAHPDCTFCFSNGYVERAGGNRSDQKEKIIPWGKASYLKGKIDSIYNVGEIELLGYIPTASFLFPNKIRKREPEISEDAFKGDGFLKLYTTYYGYAYFLQEETCVYRLGVPDSLTTRWKKDKKNYADYAHKFALMYKELNEWMNYQFNNVLEMRQYYWEMLEHIKLGDYNALRNKQYRKYMHVYHRGFKIRYWTYYFCPFIACKLDQMRG